MILMLLSASHNTNKMITTSTLQNRMRSIKNFNSEIIQLEVKTGLVDQLKTLKLNMYQVMLVISHKLQVRTYLVRALPGRLAEPSTVNTRSVSNTQ